MANHLKNEHSPYLQQHANDPIAWYPWGEEALTKARTEQKPIFLSIGYSSCHWCRVMAEESFGEEAIATILNREFISIMIDKEERPDLDSYFQAIYRIMNGSEGGWPTSLFLSDHLKPFYSATYIPDEPKYAMMSFSSLLEVIAHKYTHEKKTLLTEANRVLAQLHPKKESIQATKLDRSIIDRYRIQAQGLFDQQAGGFSTSPKFPQTTTLSTLLDIYTLTQDTSALEMVEMTLKAMAQGGLRDSIDGGFYRYTTDEAWRDPHFEKMTYDQAHLSDLYLQAYHTTQDPFYRDIAFETLEFMLEKMSDDGLFYTASNQHTQAYASLTAQEARHAFEEAKIPTKAHDALIEALHLGVDSSIIRVDTQHAQTLPYYPEAHQALKALRATHDYPAIDTKIILSWSAMITTSLLKASHLEPRYLTPALHALDQLLTTFYHNGTLFHTTIRGEPPTIEAFFEDYAYLSETLLYAYEVTSDEVFLITATKLLNSAIEQYYLAGRWRVTQGEFETYATLLDSPYTSPVAIVLQALQALSVLVDPVYLKFVFKTLEFHSYDLMRQPISTPAMSQTVIGYLQGERVLKL